MESVRPVSASHPDHRLWWRRVGWLLLIWAASVFALGVVAFGMRLFMGWAGLTR